MSDYEFEKLTALKKICKELDTIGFMLIWMIAIIGMVGIVIALMLR